MARSERSKREKTFIHIHIHSEALSESKKCKKFRIYEQDEWNEDSVKGKRG